jgi:hypothetical protein
MPKGGVLAPFGYRLVYSLRLLSAASLPSLLVSDFRAPSPGAVVSAQAEYWGRTLSTRDVTPLERAGLPRRFRVRGRGGGGVSGREEDPVTRFLAGVRHTRDVLRTADGVGGRADDCRPELANAPILPRSRRKAIEDMHI